MEKQDLSLSAPAQLQGIPAPSTPQPKQTIYNQVKAWIHGAFTKVFETPDALHRRFLADEKSIKFEYASVVEFYAGLEGMLGSPSVNVMHAMEKANVLQMSCWSRRRSLNGLMWPRQRLARRLPK